MNRELALALAYALIEARGYTRDRAPEIDGDVPELFAAGWAAAVEHLIGQFDRVCTELDIDLSPQLTLPLGEEDP